MVGDGGFGQNPAMLATAREMNLGVIWVVMNNNAFGTIAGLQKAHYGLNVGTTFSKDVDESGDLCRITLPLPWPMASEACAFATQPSSSRRWLRPSKPANPASSMWP